MQLPWLTSASGRCTGITQSVYDSSTARPSPKAPQTAPYLQADHREGLALARRSRLRKRRWRIEWGDEKRRCRSDCGRGALMLRARSSGGAGRAPVVRQPHTSCGQPRTLTDLHGLGMRSERPLPPSQMLGCAVNRLFKRRGRDLNPRGACTPNGFRDSDEYADLQVFLCSCASWCASEQPSLPKLRRLANVTV